LVIIALQEVDRSEGILHDGVLRMLLQKLAEQGCGLGRWFLLRWRRQDIDVGVLIGLELNGFGEGGRARPEVALETDFPELEQDFGIIGSLAFCGD